jgi:hypothetical protein
MSYRWLSVFSVLLFILGCASAGNEKTNAPSSGLSSSAVVTFVNKTAFRAHITVGSMAVELKPIEPGEKTVIANIYDKTEAFYFSFDIPLLYGSFDLLNVRPVDAGSYFYIDNAVPSQEIIIPAPSEFDLAGSYIVITNKSQKGGVFLSENRSSRLVCVHDHKKSSINQGESEVFSTLPNANKVLYITAGSEEYAFSMRNYRPAWAYYFIFDGNEVIPTDARPLVDVGKSAPFAVEFAGDYMSERERQQLTTALTAGLENSQIPLYPLSTSELSLFDERVFYAMQISLNTQIVPAQPPINRDLIRGELQLSLMRNGKVLAVSEITRFTEMSREFALNTSSNFLPDLCQALFSEVYK